MRRTGTAPPAAEELPPGWVEVARYGPRCLLVNSLELKITPDLVAEAERYLRGQYLRGE